MIHPLRACVFGVLTGVLVAGCSGNDAGPMAPAGSPAATTTTAGPGASSAATGSSAGGASAGTGLTTTAGGSGGGGGTAGGTPDAGTAGGANPPSDAGPGLGDAGVDPSHIVLAAVPGNGTIGLEWSRVTGATGYRLYWSNAAGVTVQTGQAIDGAVPGYVHRGLTNGTGYYYAVAAVGPTGEGPLSNEVKGTPAGEWVLEQLGPGDFDDVLTGNRVARVPVEKRVHVFLLPEGYLSTDLATFHNDASHGSDRRNDVDRWIDQVFGLEAYQTFKESMVVWFLPRASNTHTDGADTAFKVQVSASGVGTTSAAAAPLFSAVDNQGTDAFLFPPVAGSRNYIAAFLIFDPRSARAGVSGLTTTLRSPQGNLSIPSSFGIDHFHEFTHAFSNVRDEYLDTGNSASGTSETSNVVATNKCGELPWAHLLAGAGINTTPGLVGAFGRPMQGYHSEFKCLMNGTHDNGQYYCSAATAPSLTLRVSRMCNWCRELTVFHVFERTGILLGQNAFATWKSDYRAKFYARFPFRVPAPVPQSFTCNGMAMTADEACLP